MFEFLRWRKNAGKWDARFNLPRPANAQHLSSYKALQRVVSDAIKTAVITVMGLVSFWAVYFIWQTLTRIGFRLDEYWQLIFFAGLVIVVVAFLDCWNIWGAYNILFQRETFGSSRRATIRDLRDADMLVKESDLETMQGRVPLAPIGWKYWIAPKVEEWLRHSVVFGPPGSGKSASFFMWIARYWARVGGSVLLDIKGELYEYCAHYFGKVYRLDLQNSEYSDHFDLFGPCKGNAEVSSDVANYILGVDPNSKDSGGSDPFWKKSAAALLKLLILHLCEEEEYLTPTHIFEFLTKYPAIAKTPGGEFYNALAEQLAESPNAQVRREYGALFSTLSNRTFSSILVTMLTDFEPFTDPQVLQALTPPTAEEKAAGRKTIDFLDFRKLHDTPFGARGAALFVVVPEGKASRLETVLATFFALANDAFTRSGKDWTVPVMTELDEAGNVPNRKLSERVGVGRGLGIAYLLGFQNFMQPEKQYGKSTALAILQSIGMKIFLPGLTGETAEYAVKMIGKTTIQQRSTTDAVKDNFDHERLSEAARDLVDTSELRQMMKHTQCVIVIDNVRPIFARFPDNAKLIDSRRTFPNVIGKRVGDAPEKARIPVIYAEEVFPKIFAPVTETSAAIFAQSQLPQVFGSAEVAAHFAPSETRTYTVNRAGGEKVSLETAIPVVNEKSRTNGKNNSQKHKGALSSDDDEFSLPFLENTAQAELEPHPSDYEFDDAPQEEGEFLE